MRKYGSIIIIFIIGLSIFMYPIVSNILMKGTSAKVINEYTNDVKNLSENELDEIEKEAAVFNKELAKKNITYIDPFDEAQNDESRSSVYSALNIGESIGSIEIPKLELESPIYEGTSDEALNRGIGHLSNSSLPVGGESTHTILSGHRGMPSAEMFRHLDKLEIGDTFYIHTLNKVLAYKIREIRVVLPYETEDLVINQNEDLATLVTCDPYMINTHRMLVTGERVFEKELEKAGDETEKPRESGKEIQSPFIKPIIFILAIVIGLFLLWILWKRRKKKKKQQRDE